jgi:DNA transformation protein
MSEFTDYLNEVFELFGPIRARKMFGGYGIYHDGIMFGLVADDTLYLKVDGTIKDLFLERGLGAFQYEKNGRLVSMSYHLAPDEIFDDPEMAREWARRSFEVAFRARAGTNRKSKA